MGKNERIRIFIHGFDEKLDRGILPGSIVLLVGEPGTIKSTIASNLLYQSALREQRARTHISLEQGRDNPVARTSESTGRQATRIIADRATSSSNFRPSGFGPKA